MYEEGVNFYIFIVRNLGFYNNVMNDKKDRVIIPNHQFLILEPMPHPQQILQTIPITPTGNN